MKTLRRPPEFSGWLKDLRDQRAKASIAQRLTRLAEGHFGDVKFFEGIGELKIDYGPGYQVYFQQRGAEIVILLCGGDKSTQKRDINKAVDLALHWSDDDGED